MFSPSNVNCLRCLHVFIPAETEDLSKVLAEPDSLLLQTICFQPLPSSHKVLTHTASFLCPVSCVPSWSAEGYSGFRIPCLPLPTSFHSSASYMTCLANLHKILLSSCHPSVANLHGVLTKCQSLC